MNSPVENLSTENVITTAGMTPLSEDMSSIKGQNSSGMELPFEASRNLEKLSEFSDSFVQWVTYGQTICH
ncbi:hypothetical protein Taro_001435 [Colocasia esculenta]|uniref:Uncharacterized protein n=1 Tax=Colocasia esculenta TaxID=4460 RepID=A0A843TAZ0_COLES|nr:hypothetical protein [Colocasia esculenta]